MSWTNNSLNTSAAETSLLLYDGETYYFSVKAKNGAGLFSDISVSDGIIVDISTDILQYPVDNIFVFIHPNPTKDLLNIEIKNIVNPFIEIINIKGQIIYSKFLNTNLTQIDISEYSKGVYFLKVTGNSDNQNPPIINEVHKIVVY